MNDRFWRHRTRARLQSAFQDGHCVLIDIGSSKISCAMLRNRVLARQLPSRNQGAIDRKWEIIGHTVTAVQGVDNGEIRDTKSVEATLRSALRLLFKMAKVVTKHALVSYSGPIVRSEVQSAACLLSAPVTSQDLSRAVANCRPDQQRGYGEFTIHEHPVDVRIDGIPVTGDPIGCLGRRLILHLHQVTIPRYAVERLESTLNKCGLLLAGLNLASLASGMATLGGAELSDKTLLVDIGSATTNIAAFNRRTMIWSTTLALGGEDLTQEICTTFGIDRFQAERIKILYGNAIKIPGDSHDQLTFLGGSRIEGREVTISRDLLHAALIGKQGELIEGISACLDTLGWCDDGDTQVVLTGGGSLLAGLAESLRDRISNPVRAGKPVRVAGMPESMRSDPFATLIGLALLGIRPLEEVWNYPHITRFGISPSHGLLKHTAHWLVANW